MTAPHAASNDPARGAPGATVLVGEAAARIRERALVALALNRTPGYHFPAHLARLSFDAVSDAGAELSIDPGPHCLDARGHLDLGVLAMVADIAMSATIRAGLSPAQRLGTVSMSLHLTGDPGPQRLHAGSTFEGFVSGADGRQATARFKLRSGARSIGFGGGSFMVLDPPPGVTMHPTSLRTHADPLPAPLAPDALGASEHAILARVDAAIAAADSGAAFIERFWGTHSHPQARPQRSADDPRVFTALRENTLHVGNRVGHMQGGLMYAFGVETANAALEAGGGRWRTTAVSAAFVSPGDGSPLVARTVIVHRGGLTALAHTAVTRPDGRIALDVVSQHAALGSAEHAAPGSAEHAALHSKDQP